jgi:glycerophosphoryl diester phosphodiesterase
LVALSKILTIMKGVPGLICVSPSPDFAKPKSMKTLLLTTIAGLLFTLPSFAQQQPDLTATGAQVLKWRIGHRGDETEHVQNSMPAFLGALHLGASMVELDVRNTKDHVTVIHHDPNLGSYEECGALNGQAISHLTLAEIKSCHFKKDQTQIPTFSELLQATQSSKMGLLIELKDSVQADVIRLLSKLDPQHECAAENPSQEIKNKTFQCFENTIIYSFGESWIEDVPSLLSQHPELHRIRLLKLVPPSENRQLLTEQGAHFWNVDGIAFEINSLGADLETVTQKMNELYPNQIKLIWSGNGQMDFARVDQLPITGIIASDIHGLIDFEKAKHP